MIRDSGLLFWATLYVVSSCEGDLTHSNYDGSILANASATAPFNTGRRHNV